MRQGVSAIDHRLMPTCLLLIAISSHPSKHFTSYGTAAPFAQSYFPDTENARPLNDFLPVRMRMQRLNKPVFTAGLMAIAMFHGMKQGHAASLLRQDRIHHATYASMTPAPLPHAGPAQRNWCV